MTGVSRCGIPSYIENSSIFGSIMIRRRVCGLLRYKRLKSIAFIPTLLPEPVVPAISKCGSFLRSVTKGAPTISLPSAIVSSLFAVLKISLSSTSRR